LVVSVGVKVMPTLLAPAVGTVVGEVNANVPGTDAVPPVRVASDRAVPNVMLPAVGGVVIVGVARAIVIGMDVVAVV
jgi:hypothetical protein